MGDALHAQAPAALIFTNHECSLVETSLGLSKISDWIGLVDGTTFGLGGEVEWEQHDGRIVD